MHGKSFSFWTHVYVYGEYANEYIYIYTVNVLISPALAFVNLPGAQPAPSCGMDPQAFVGSGSPIGAEEGGFF